MWMKWLPWRFIVRRVARAQGFADPMKILSQLENFSEPSEVLAPVELLRLAAVLQARGLMNSQAIQHNLDWIWPYWVVRQFDPHDPSFVPRAFSLTHINLTHRNWTAIGIPDFSNYPIIDPRGLLTPFYDGWSLDSWIVSNDGDDLIPSKLASISQKLICTGNLAVETEALSGTAVLHSRAEVFKDNKGPVCRLSIRANSRKEASWLAVSLRPYNPEGVSFIHTIESLKDLKGWKVNDKHDVLFNETPASHHFSSYGDGDVYQKLFKENPPKEVSCDVGMATAAVLYKLEKAMDRELIVHVPLHLPASEVDKVFSQKPVVQAATLWENALKGSCRFQVPDTRFQYLYETSLRTILLHTPNEVYAGPFTYKHFWFRDAVFIVHALLAAGLTDRAQLILDSFPGRQRPMGYFCSQDGEWDSNGQVLWILNRFYEWTGKIPNTRWVKAALKACHWIQHKRLSKIKNKPHAGLFPAGFSAEHLGPNDYYYWDDFWGVAGLRAATPLLCIWGAGEEASLIKKEADIFLLAIEESLQTVHKRLGNFAMPASPYRRMDSGAIGSIAASYPLGLWPAHDPRIVATVEYLLKECFVDGGFFHNMSHSGINPYLTLHVAQALLRADDSRYFKILKDLARLASPTGQWPEAIHPQIGDGCMGDGQHVWAAAEWILMMRSLFIREGKDHLCFGAGIPYEWLRQGKEMVYGPAPTKFGPVTLSFKPSEEKIVVSWKTNWRVEPPTIEVRLPGQNPVISEKGRASIECPFESV